MEWLLPIVTAAAAIWLGTLARSRHDDLRTWQLGFKCGRETVELIIDASGYTIKDGEHGEFIVPKADDDTGSGEP